MHRPELRRPIGARARYLAAPHDSWAHIAGFTLVNDVSEREFQMERGGQWSKGKSCETFNPCGPWLVTPDEIPDVHDLGMTPTTYLTAGDVIELGIDHLGTQRQRLIAAD